MGCAASVPSTSHIAIRTSASGTQRRWSLVGFRRVPAVARRDPSAAQPRLLSCDRGCAGDRRKRDHSEGKRSVTHSTHSDSRNLPLIGCTEWTYIRNRAGETYLFVWGCSKDIVDIVAERLKEKEAHLAPAQDIKEAWKELPVQEHPESTLVGPEQGASAEEVAELQ